MAHSGPKEPPLITDIAAPLFSSTHRDALHPILIVVIYSVRNEYIRAVSSQMVAQSTFALRRLHSKKAPDSFRFKL